MILSKAVRLAVFPFNSKLITNSHHKDLNFRLTAEMQRLFKGVAKILENHMMIDEKVIEASFQMDDEDINDRSSGPTEVQKMKRVTDIKKGSISYSEYKEFCHLI